MARFLLLLALIIGPTPLWGVEEDGAASLAEESLAGSLKKEKWDRDAPVDIHSEQMTVDFEGHRIVFKGNVRVVQSDFSLKADEVTATFGASADDIEKIVAADEVKIQKADKMAWGEQAVYDRQTATILLSGNAVLQQGRNFIKGNEIRFSLDADRMEVKGGVQAEFLMSGQKTDLDVQEQGTGPAGGQSPTPGE